MGRVRILLWVSTFLSLPAFAGAEDLARLTVQPRTRATPPKPCPTVEELGYELKELMEINLDHRIVDRELPADCSVDLFHEGGPGIDRRAWAETEFSWAASEIYHQPLYWDETILERYGQHRPLLQPAISGAHFFATFPAIPYKIGLDRTHDHIYNLGYYRVGTPTPCLRSWLPWEWDAAALEAAAWTIPFLIP